MSIIKYNLFIIIILRYDVITTFFSLYFRQEFQRKLWVSDLYVLYDEINIFTEFNLK